MTLCVRRNNLRHELTVANLTEFRERFKTFHDGLVHQVDINLYRVTTPKANIRIELEARDFVLSDKGQWVKLVFEVEDVTKYVLHQERNYNLTVISRLNVGIFDNEIFFDFEPYDYEPQSAADFELRPFVPKAMFLIIGERCFWYIKEILEPAT